MGVIHVLVQSIVGQWSWISGVLGLAMQRASFRFTVIYVGMTRRIHSEALVRRHSFLPTAFLCEWGSFTIVFNILQL